MIKTYIEQAIRNLEAEKAQKISEVESKVLQGKVAQYYAEADKARDSEVGDLTVDFNKAIQELQNKFAVEKQAIVDKYAAEKSAFREQAVSMETSALAYEYDRHIAKLQEMVTQ